MPGQTSANFAVEDLDGVTVTRGVMATMRDGVRLSADVYRPQQGDAWPVLLLRQPYGRDIASTVVYAQPAWFARQGYLVVVQDVRGRGGSDGVFYPFRHEIQDGYDSVMWAAGLPGSTGKVGMYGFSYQGSTQLLAAIGRPPALKAIAPHMTAFDLYSGWFYRAGMLQLHTTLTWGNQMLRENARRAGAQELSARLERSWTNPAALCLASPIAAVEPLTDAGAASFVRDWLEHGEYDAYWRELDLERRIEELEVPMFHLAGWYDYYLRGTMSGYRAAQGAHPAKQYLVCGPWVHIPWGTQSTAGGLGANARVDTDALLVRWFDHWLKDRPAGEDISGVTYFVLQEDAWKRAASWPPPDAIPQRWYLQSEGRANSVFGDGRLSADSASGACDHFVYDPEVPVLAPGGQGSGGLSWGPADLSASHEGNNLLVYSVVATREFTVVGAPILRLFVRSTAVDTCLVAKLSHVSQNGVARFICLGAETLKNGKPQPDGTIELMIALDDTACHWRAGDRLRLDLASSAFPLLARHPNTAMPINRSAYPRDYYRATQSVYHDSLHPSVLEVALLP